MGKPDLAHLGFGYGATTAVFFNAKTASEKARKDLKEYIKTAIKEIRTKPNPTLKEIFFCLYADIGKTVFQEKARRWQDFIDFLQTLSEQEMYIYMRLGHVDVGSPGWAFVGESEYYFRFSSTILQVQELFFRGEIIFQKSRLLKPTISNIYLKLPLAEYPSRGYKIKSYYDAFHLLNFLLDNLGKLKTDFVIKKSIMTDKFSEYDFIIAVGPKAKEQKEANLKKNKGQQNIYY